MSDFTGVFGADQGLSVDLNRDSTADNLGTLPRLLRDSGALAFGDADRVVAVPSLAGNPNVFDSNLQMPRTRGRSRSAGSD